MGTDLYIVDYPDKTPYAEAALIDVGHDYAATATCPRCGRYVSGAYWAKPREVVLTKRKMPDFLYAYCDNVPFLLSERALHAIREAGLTGILRAEPIETIRFQRRSSREVTPLQYYHIELMRSAMTIDHGASNIRYGHVPGGSYEQICPLCRPVSGTYDFFRSLAFRMEEYEGQDLFHTYELGDTVIVSGRFVELCKNCGLNNLHYEPVQRHGSRIASYFLDGDENT